MQTIAETIGKIMSSKHLTVSLAESCTGGLIASMLTDIPGSSVYVKGGVVSYTNEVKNKLLGVPLMILNTYTAISRETAIAMARGVKNLMATDYSIAVTGNAGPGLSEGKPRGLVYIAVADSVGVQCEERYFLATRTENKKMIAMAALELLLQKLEK